MQWDAVVNSVVSTLTSYLRLSGNMHSCAHAERLELVGLEAHGTPQVQVHDGETFMVAYWGELVLIDLMSQGTRTLHRRCYPPPQDEEDMLLARPDLKAELRFCEGR
jgi:hypothetical protein